MEFASKVSALPITGAHLNLAESDVRNELSNKLPHLLRRAMANYHDFSSEAPPLSAKGFAAHQAGCRASLAHIHLLLKLYDCILNTSESVQTFTHTTRIDQLIQEAEQAISATNINSNAFNASSDTGHLF